MNQESLQSMTDQAFIRYIEGLTHNPNLFEKELLRRLKLLTGYDNVVSITNTEK